MPITFHWKVKMHRVVTIGRCVMVPVRLSTSHRTARSSSSRFSTKVRRCSRFGHCFFLDFHIFKLCVGLELCQRVGVVTLGRDIRDFPHDPLKLSRFFGLLLVVQGDFLAEFPRVRHCCFCCCCFLELLLYSNGCCLTQVFFSWQVLPLSDESVTVKALSTRSYRNCCFLFVNTTRTCRKHLLSNRKKCPLF